MPRLPQNASDDVKRLNPEIYGSVVTADQQVPKACLVVGSEPRGSRISETTREESVRRGTEEKLNKTERRWLESLRAKHSRIGIQNVTLRLANGVRYTPDFYLGEISCFYEVKGAFIREDAWIKLKTAASLFPEFRFVMAQWKDKQWIELEIKP